MIFEEVGCFAGSLAFGYARAETLGLIGVAIGGPAVGVAGAFVGGVSGGIYKYSLGRSEGDEYYRALE